MTTEMRQKTIIDLLSEEIALTLINLSREQRHPGFDSDNMDFNLKEFESKAKALRDIREKLENLFTGALLD